MLLLVSRAEPASELYERLHELLWLDFAS
ncbi:hypothetical protein D046_6803A, partial [Vibrio parahaemolyticus V-223/04]